MEVDLDDDSVIDEPKIFQKLSRKGQMYILSQKQIE